jgi:hypothetical protein
LQGLSDETASARSPILARDRRCSAHCDRQRETPEAGQIIKSGRQAATERETADTPEYAIESSPHPPVSAPGVPRRRSTPSITACVVFPVISVVGGRLLKCARWTAF